MICWDGLRETDFAISSLMERTVVVPEQRTVQDPDPIETTFTRKDTGRRLRMGGMADTDTASSGASRLRLRVSGFRVMLRAPSFPVDRIDGASKLLRASLRCSGAEETAGTSGDCCRPRDFLRFGDADCDVFDDEDEDEDEEDCFVPARGVEAEEEDEEEEEEEEEDDIVPVPGFAAGYEDCIVPAPAACAVESTRAPRHV
jgi:hypothetical protein